MRFVLLACVPAVVLGQPSPSPGPSQAGDVGKSTYAMSNPFAYKDFAEKYLPTSEFIVQKNDTSTCVEWVKLCIEDGTSTTCEGREADGNFQVHSVGAYKRESGSKSMQEIEMEWTKSMGNMDKFDPFFDFNIGFLATDLDYFISAFEKDKVPFFASTFTDPGTQKQYKTILVQEETWKATCEKERMVEVLNHPAPKTYHEEAQVTGPAVSTAHATHISQCHVTSATERPAGKASAIGMHWGIQ